MFKKTDKKVNKIVNKVVESKEVEEIIDKLAENAVNKLFEEVDSIEYTEENGNASGAEYSIPEDYVEEIIDNPEVLKASYQTRGLDISVYQRGLSLQAVKDAGYEFVILRAGFTGWGGNGTSKYKDSCFEDFYNEAKRVGLKVGAYWYSCADNSANGKSEAQYMINNCLKGKQFELPIAMDVEDSHHQAPAGKKNLTDAVIAFCEELENNGYYASIYANVNFFNNYLDTSRLNDYDKWLALWNSSSSKPTYMNGNFGLWQNSSSGSVGGYRVDTNYCYKDYASIMKSANLNGFSGSTPTQEPKPEPEPEPTPEWPKYYVVQENDSLSKIALKFYGNGDYNHYMCIARANGITNPNIIYSGVKLTIPEYSAPTQSLNVGDKVKIISNYASSSSSKAAYNSAAIGWERVIMKIYSGTNYPYQVGDGKGVTGYCKESGLRKL